MTHTPAFAARVGQQRHRSAAFGRPGTGRLCLSARQPRLMLDVADVTLLQQQLQAYHSVDALVVAIHTGYSNFSLGNLVFSYI